MQNDFTQIIYLLFHCFAGRERDEDWEEIYLHNFEGNDCLYLYLWDWLCVKGDWSKI